MVAQGSASRAAAIIESVLILATAGTMDQVFPMRAAESSRMVVRRLNDARRREIELEIAENKEHLQQCIDSELKISRGPRNSYTYEDMRELDDPMSERRARIDKLRDEAEMLEDRELRIVALADRYNELQVLIATYKNLATCLDDKSEFRANLCASIGQYESQMTWVRTEAQALGVTELVSDLQSSATASDMRAAATHLPAK